MRSVFLVLSFLLLGLLTAQTGPRTWHDHLGFNSCNTVTKLNGTVYASNRNGIIHFSASDFHNGNYSVDQLNKINGLNDVGIKLLRTNTYNNKILVIYENSNIDVIDQNGNVSNYSDIKLKPFSGKKYINEVFFYKQYAYLACGFGIIVFDTEKLEVKNTYVIGPGGTNIEVYEVALNDTLIFAGTENGVYKSNPLTKNLNNYNNWIKDSTLPAGPYGSVITISGKFLSAYSPSIINNIKDLDTVYIYENNKWIKYPPMAGGQNTVYKLSSTYTNLLAIKDKFGIMVREFDTGQINNTCYSIAGISPVYINDIYFDKDETGNVSYWIADNVMGLYQNYLYYTPYNKVEFNGTHSAEVGNLDVFKGRTALAPGYVDVTGVGPATREGVNVYKDGEWSYIPSNDLSGNPVVCLTSVFFDRLDTSVLWASSWFYGILKYKNNRLVNTWNYDTPGMPTRLPKETRCSGLSMDKDGNLWFANSDIINYLSVIKRNGELLNFRFDNPRFVRKTYVDKNNYVWVLHQGDGGITVMKNDNINSTNPVYKRLTKDVGNGNLQANAVSAFAEDRDGKIWIGTTAGISVFYNPSNIFGNGDFDSQPIKIVQDGNVELLLGNETVLSLCVDGANNKWAGTVTGGLYCFSPDGQTQLYHFTKENSPLYSNTIVDIKYDEITGDVFIGTDVGVQSFRNIVLAGAEEYTNVIAYPNPVRPTYRGTVLIKGLVDKSLIKITDSSGNLVWETKSSGGQIEWPITNLGGARVTTGVYTAYATTTNGEMRTLTKILVMN